jgi:hypothetical protein
VYDMYPWARQERRSGKPARERGVPVGRPPGLTHAVQVALDRRDNGGDAAAAAPDAGAPATPAEPTAGPTRQ